MVYHSPLSDTPFTTFDMRSIYLIASLSLVIFNIGFTQTIYERPPYDQIWLLNQSFIDFDTGQAEVQSSPITTRFEGTNASICNDYGELLTYTNGFFVGDINGDTILNGNGLNPGDHPEWWYSNGSIWPQGALFLPQENGMILLHKTPKVVEGIDEDGDDSVVSFDILTSKIDIDANEVLSKNISVANDTFSVGDITASRHANGLDWWVLSPTYSRGEYLKLVVTNDSIHNIGIQTVGQPVQTGLGQAKFSPQGDCYAILDIYSVDRGIVSIYNFDRCSGQLSNHRFFTIDKVALTGGLEFSPNGRFLYVSYFAYTFQYDLAAEDIAASQVTISAPDDGWGYYMAQLAPDDKIYICVQGAKDSLHVIEHPNRKGHACDFRHLGLPLPEISFRTMPNFPYYGLGPLDGSPCDTINIDNPVPEAAFEYIATDTSTLVEFFDASHFMPAYDERLVDERIGWQWDFGDGSRGDTTRFPVYTFRQSGTYEVCLTVSNVTGADTYCAPVTVGPNSVGGPAMEDVAIQVWPNPLREGPLYVEVLGDDSLLDSGSAIHFTLRDVQGRMVYTQDLNNATQGTTALDLSSLPAGLYFYELVDRKGYRLGSGRLSIVDR